MSMIEFTGEVGLMVGPPIATFLYRLGGYSLPFRVIGAMEIVLVILCFIVFPCEAITLTCDSSKNIASRPQSQSAALNFVKKPGLLITSLPPLFIIASLSVGSYMFWLFLAKT